MAVVHDWFQGFHGSERVVKVMADDVFAEASAVDIYTFAAADDVIPDSLSRRIVQTSRLSALPGLRQRGHDRGRWRGLLPLMPRYFRQLDLAGYDIVVASSHSCAIHARPAADAVHVCYAYTPMRYAWLSDVDHGRASGVQGLALGAIAGHLRRVDYRAAQRVGSFVTLSTAVAERIRRFYGREAEVISPPVDVDDFAISAERERGRFLWAHRMVPYKHPLEVMEAFRGLDANLTMIGVGPLHERVKHQAPANVDVHGWLDRDVFADQYARATAFIHIGEEDFGITIVEALAAGLPVIALNRGGATDIVRPGIDGVLIEHPTAEELRRALQEVNDRSWDPRLLRERSNDFSRARFVRRFREHLAGLIEASRSSEPARSAQER